MRYCFYRTATTAEARVGAMAPWDTYLIVDVHLAEVAWFATRVAVRRAYELADHLVPASPSAFIVAGAAVWDFAHEAVAAVTPETAAPRGERISLPATACLLDPIVEHLVGGTAPLHAEAVASDRPVAAVIGRRADRLAEHRAWDHVAAFVRYDGDPRWLDTADELGDDDANTYCAVAELISTHSAALPLGPGDVVFAGTATTTDWTLVSALAVA